MDVVIQSFGSREIADQREIQRVVYGDGENYELIKLYKTFLRRAYEGMRAEVGSHLIHYEVLQRYKARCMWYDRQRIAKMVEEGSGGEEAVLTNDLALYLFDNGISTLYRIRRGVHEYDLMGHRIDPPIFVEVKVYKNSKNARRNLVGGLAQLHSYLNGLEAEDLFVGEVYYVIYRLGGPLYDLPWEISTSRRRFYPIIIDLGSSKESGRRQPKPIQIASSDFFKAIEQEEQNDTG